MLDASEIARDNMDEYTTGRHIRLCCKMRNRLFSIIFCGALCCFFHAIPATAQLIESTPSGAKVYFEGSYLGKTPLRLWESSFPYELVYKIRRDRIDDESLRKPPYSYVLTLKMDGYEDQTVRIVGEWKYISSIRDIDCVAGLKSNRISAVMEKKDTPVNLEEAPKVHWGIDSEPCGARVFWKVTSSIPDIVKSTDYIYLGTTPIDTTKPLTIKGLTSENASQVNIHLRIQSKGYKTTTKSFSAELLTEQNELSWFFELDAE